MMSFKSYISHIQEGASLEKSGFTRLKGQPKKAARKLAYALKKGDYAKAQERYTRKSVSQMRRVGDQLDRATRDFKSRMGLADESVKESVSEAARGLVGSKNKWSRIDPTQTKGNTDVQSDIYDMIKQTYGGLGGHPDFPSRDRVPHDNDGVDIIDTDGPDDIDATILSKKTMFGRKMTTIATDGQQDSKRAMLSKSVELLQQRGNYMEASGKVLEILISKGAKPVTDQKTVEKVLTGKTIHWHGDHPEGLKGEGWYSRTIGGKMHTKMMLGNPIP